MFKGNIPFHIVYLGVHELPQSYVLREILNFPIVVLELCKFLRGHSRKACPFCTVNRAKYEIPSTSNEENITIILEEKYDFPNYQLKKS